MDEAVVGDAAHLDAGRFAFLQHFRKRWLGNFQSNVEVVVVLLLEHERPVGRLEEREARAVVHAVEAVQHRGAPSALRLADNEGIGERQAEEVLVEAPRLLRVPAAIGVVVQALDHERSRIYCKVTNC
ncbi:hypothetical protein AYO46_04625 [Betaproteobacteria bacterium SCGC AG-212-J23]|nr:hypothetical protein AYO46_04625 [Betaproteobacteria bacterium SCGC AG-212-J23]